MKCGKKLWIWEQMIHHRNREDQKRTIHIKQTVLHHAHVRYAQESTATSQIFDNI